MFNDDELLDLTVPVSVSGSSLSDLDTAVDAWCVAAREAGVDAEPLRVQAYSGAARVDQTPWEIQVSDGLARPLGRWGMHVQFATHPFPDCPDPHRQIPLCEGFLTDSDQLGGGGWTIVDYEYDTLIVTVLTSRGPERHRVTADDLSVQEGTPVYVSVTAWLCHPTTGDDVFEPAETYYAGLAERSEAWTTAAVAAFLHRVRGRETTPRYADVWLRRHGIPALGREPGRAGQNLYDGLLAEHAWRNSPGQGARTDLPTSS